MTTYKLFFAGVALMCACAASDTVSPIACNLKAFVPQERAQWRQRLDQAMSAVTSKRPLPVGYSLKIDARKATFRDVAEWVELERKCCPFFTFKHRMQAEDGAVWLNLRGRRGVKEFIAAYFHTLFD